MMTVASGLNDMRGLARPSPLLSPTATPTGFAGLLDASSLAPDAATGEAAAAPSLLPSAAAATDQGAVPLVPSILDQLPIAAAVSRQMQDGGAPVVAAAPTATPAAVAAPPPATPDIPLAPTAARLPSRASWSGKVTPPGEETSAELLSTSPAEVPADAAAVDPTAKDAAISVQIDRPALDDAVLHAAQPDAPVPVVLVTARTAAAEASSAAVAEHAPALNTGAAAAVAADHPALRRNLPSLTDNQAPTMPSEPPITALPLTNTLPVSDGTGVDLAEGAAEMILPQASAVPSSSSVTTTQPASLAGDVPLRLIDLGADDRWIASLAKDIAALQDKDGLLRFQLLPRHLGRLEVSVQTGSEGISVRVAAENAAAQSMLAGAQTRLVDDLRNNGVRIAAAEIGMQAQGWTNDRRDNDRPHPDQRWSFVETGHAADPVPLRTRGPGTDRLA